MMRTSLASIFGNRNRYHEYTPFQRGVIARAVGHGATPHRINKLYGIPISSIKTIVSNALIRHNGDSKSRSRRPRKLTVRDERHILKIVCQNPKITYKALVEKSRVFVSHDTLYRLLKEEGITN